MPKPFDATLKDLIRQFPADWLTLVGETITETPEVLSADLSTVTASADTLIRLGNRVIHIDLESGPDDDFASRMLQYNVLAYRLIGLPVRTVAVLLRPKAQSSNLVDVVEYEQTRFRFDIIRVWEHEAEEFLNGGLGLLPMAVIARPPRGQTREASLPGVVEQIAQRAKKEAPPLVADIVLSSFILAGLHVNQAILQGIYRRALGMIESVAFDIIMEDGAMRHTRKLIIRWAAPKLGKPTKEQVERMNAILDLERLERILERVQKVKSWDSLLKTR
jgi:hypothetical protein